MRADPNGGPREQARWRAGWRPASAIDTNPLMEKGQRCLWCDHHKLVRDGHYCCRSLALGETWATRAYACCDHYRRTPPTQEQADDAERELDALLAQEVAP